MTKHAQAKNRNIRNRTLLVLLGLMTAFLIFNLMPGLLNAQVTNDPFKTPIETTQDVITIGFEEFAMLPDVEEEAALAMDLELEPDGERYFVNDLHGILYTVSQSGDVIEYLNLSEWKLNRTFS